MRLGRKETNAKVKIVKSETLALDEPFVEF